MATERRRRAEPPEWTPLRQIGESIAAANCASAGSDEAHAHAARAMFEVLKELTPALDANITSPLRSGDTSQNQRLQVLQVLRFINKAMLFPALEDLSIDLHELDRGVVGPRLEGKSGGRRGGTSTTMELQVMREIVEAADALRLLAENDEEYRAQLEALGCPYSTVEGHRRKLARGPSEFRRPRSYLLAYGNKTPTDILREAAQRLSRVRREQNERREKGR